MSPTDTPNTLPVAPAAPAKFEKAAKPAPAGRQLWDDVAAPRYQPGQTAWLLTFVDLTGLMVVFFVLMFSRQTLESDKWEIVSGSFKAKFAPREAVLESVVDGVNNAETPRVVARSGLGYLDVLLLQHLERSKQWSGLRGTEQQGVRGREMVYAIAPEQQDPVAHKADWERLGAALRGWKNPVGVRVSAPQAELQRAARQAQSLTAILNASGVEGAFAEVAEGDFAVQLVVRAR